MSETTQESLQRFAISGLSKERKDEAVNEEILLGKYTGEFFIKTKDGIIISTDILNRLKASTENAIRYAESNGMVGEVFKIDFDNIDLPCHIDYNVNVIGNEFIDIGKCNEFLINLDYDEFDIIAVYTVIPAILFVAAVILFVFDKKLNSLVEDEDEAIEKKNKEARAKTRKKKNEFDEDDEDFD